MAKNTQNEFLELVHPIHDAWADTWERNERRLEGGDAILEDLVPFDWELEAEGRVGADSREHYLRRQSQVTYINFPEMLAETYVGYLMDQAPSPGENLSFGTLGEVRRERNLSDPTRAEQIYYNVDGTGSDGSMWDNFWADVQMRAMATGHRWLMVEAPNVQVRNEAQERELGLRPYLVEFSPLDVTNWHFEHGRLMFAIVRIPMKRKPLESESTPMGYYLLVRRGYIGLGTQFAEGGWWIFDENLEPVDFGVGWERTRGEIPMWCHFYRRAKPRRDWPTMSKPGLTELGSMAVAYMNLSSAADYDAWDAAQSMQFVLGADAEGFNDVVDQVQKGSKLIAVPVNKDTQQTPDMRDGSTGAVAVEVFEKRLNRKIEEARNLSVLAMSSSPYASGLSRQAGFKESKAPRIALIAGELESSQNIAIHFLEMRWGNNNPTGSVRWTRDFNLIALREKVSSIFDLELKSGYASKTLGTRAMLAAAKESGLITDDETEAQVAAEYESAADQVIPMKMQGSFGGQTPRGTGFPSGVTDRSIDNRDPAGTQNNRS